MNAKNNTVGIEFPIGNAMNSTICSSTMHLSAGVAFCKCFYQHWGSSSSSSSGSGGG